MAPSPVDPNKGLGDCRGAGHSGRPPSSLALGAPAPGCAHPQEGLRTPVKVVPWGHHADYGAAGNNALLGVAGGLW